MSKVYFISLLDKELGRYMRPIRCLNKNEAHDNILLDALYENRKIEEVVFIKTKEEYFYELQN